MATLDMRDRAQR